MKIREPVPVKPVVSLFTAETELFSPVIGALIERLGPADFLSEPLDFSHTGYYEEEFGSALKRKIISFEHLIGPGELASIKTFTNGLEGEYLALGGKRRINIDPGYMALEKFVLASCKNFSHRIYLSGGVYAELTLIYSAPGGFRDLPWSYPDYKNEGMLALLSEIRKRLAFNIRRGCEDA